MASGNFPFSLRANRSVLFASRVVCWEEHILIERLTVQPPRVHGPNCGIDIACIVPNSEVAGDQGAHLLFISWTDTRVGLCAAVERGPSHGARSGSTGPTLVPFPAFSSCAFCEQKGRSGCSPLSQKRQRRGVWYPRLAVHSTPALRLTLLL